MTEQDDLRLLLDKTAANIAQLDNNPSTWLAWMVYLLGRLEAQAYDSNPVHREIYKDMLRTLQDNIRNRLATGGW